VELGCDQGQGPLFSPLLDANQVTALLVAAQKTAVDDR
jgi:EAL domain-containing protein (putative c-di-GMP-specific phosphodiesterase class I)